MGRYLPFLHIDSSIYIRIPSLKVSTLTIGSRGRKADFESIAQLSRELFPVPKELWCSLCVSNSSRDAREHLWTWKVVNCKHHLGVAGFVWHSHITRLKGQQCGNGNAESRAWICHLLVSFAHVKCTLVTQRPTWCPDSICGIVGINHY